MTANQIRKAFLDYFASKGHKIVPSAPMVVKNDPTLMFVNAGMNPFKDIFLGNVLATDKRVADTQKCLRVSGKHNDLEEVGVDTYHHTLFEMLGNWSFGDYFKEEAIAYAWDLLTEVYQLPKDRLYVTIFEGDAKENLERDEDSARIWAKYIDVDRILLGNKKDNFWEMGDVGPCGPCSEIHFDSRSDEERSRVDGKTLVNQDNPFVIEIWNNVFMEYNRKTDGSLVPLPSKHVDTGMGFERLVRVIQGKSSNYDTDIFQPLIAKVESLSGVKYQHSDAITDIAIRVIVDHIRAITCSIADGQIPSNTGAGYVIRRILRRAIRYGYTHLGFEAPFMFQLVEILGNQMDGVFPEIKAQKTYIENVIREEEHSFFRTLSNGIKLFQEKLAHSKNQVMSGKDVFELYDTYGFPLDLTKLMAKEQGWEIDEKGFESELTIQKNRSRNATKIDTEDWIEVQDSATHSEFIGYTQFESAVRILRYRYVKSKNGNYYQLVLNRTPFYAESGGQVGDTGALSSENGVIKIDNTVKENDTIIHVTNAVLDNMQLEFHAAIDMHKRSLTAKNHSATHLLQSALRKVLGDHVQQKGSLVNEKYLRFDFAHFAKMKDEEIKQVEELVNEKIGLEIQCRIEEHIELEEAKKRGVTALFGEKYGDFVRIVTFDEQYSMELCGGTHVKNTGNLGYFKILSESSIASGIRRIEATTSQNVIDYYREKELALMNISNLLKNPNNIITSIQNLQTENSNLKKNLQNFESYIIQNEVSRMVAKYGPSKETMILEELTGINAEVAKSICSQLRIHYPSKLIMIAVREDKLKLSIGCGDDFIAGANMDAKSIVKEISAHIQGGGGGQSTLASFVGEPTGDLDNLRAKLLTIIPAK